jgi:hypothetical protein
MRMIKEVMFIFVAVVTVCAQATPHAGDKPFDPKSYPAEKFQVTKSDYAFGELTVRVIDVKNSSDVRSTLPSYCSAWVEVLKGPQLIKRLYYGDIEPVGFSFGAFFPKQQPDNYVAIVKVGDYDGRLLLVSRAGEVVDIPGGLYFMTADRRYVISEYASDDSEPAFNVFDLVTGRIILQPKDTPEIGSWYHDESGYFVMEYGRPGRAERLDLKNRRVLKISIAENIRKAATKVRYDFDPRKKQDCVANPQ